MYKPSNVMILIFFFLLIQFHPLFTNLVVYYHQCYSEAKSLFGVVLQCY